MITLTIIGPVRGLRRLSFLAFLVQELGGADSDLVAVTQRLLGNPESIHEYTVLAPPIYNPRSLFVREYDGMSPADELRTEMNVILGCASHRQSILEQGKSKFLAVDASDKDPRYSLALCVPAFGRRNLFVHFAYRDFEFVQRFSRPATA